MAGENRIAAGFDFIFYGVLNSSGIMIGNTLTGATAGSATGHPMKRLVGARTIPISIREPEVLTVMGDNEPLVSFSFPSGELPSGILEMSVRDQGFESLVQGTTEETIGDVVMGAYDPAGTTKPDMALLLMSQAKKYEGSTKGVGAWEVLFVNSCQITPLYKDITQREFGPYRYAINLSRAARVPFGLTFTEGAHGTTEMTLTPFESDYPLMVETWQGNAAATAFNLTYTPKTTAKVYAYKNNGVRDPGATISGLTVTYAAAPASAQYAHALYEVDKSVL